MALQVRSGGEGDGVCGHRHGVHRRALFFTGVALLPYQFNRPLHPAPSFAAGTAPLPMRTSPASSARCAPSHAPHQQQQPGARPPDSGVGVRAACGQCWLCCPPWCSHAAAHIRAPLSDPIILLHQTLALHRSAPTHKTLVASSTSLSNPPRIPPVLTPRLAPPPSALMPRFPLPACICPRTAASVTYSMPDRP